MIIFYINNKLVSLKYNEAKIMLNIKWILRNIILLIGICLSTSSCQTGFPVKDSGNQRVPIPSTSGEISDSTNTELQESIIPDNGHKPNTNPIINSKIGILPFSKLVSDNVQTQIGKYYNSFENEIANVLQAKGINVTHTSYPSSQQAFTYEGMEAPAFEIDPDDFATPEQILSKISKSAGLNNIIFGHLEEVSDSLYLVARVYSSTDNKIKSMPIQKINIATVTSQKVITKINQLATDIVRLIQTSHLLQQPNNKPNLDDGLYGLDEYSK